MFPAASDPGQPARVEHDRVRVRLLVAIPVLIVLLLATMAGVLFQLTDSYFGSVNDALLASTLPAFARDFLGILLGFSAVGAIIGIYLADSITRPIRTIITLSQRVASGDLTSKAPTTSPDEVGALGTSFNRMVESLNSFFTSRNRMIVESFSGGLVTTDLNGTIVATNSAAERMLAVNAADAVGRPVEEVFTRSDLEPLVALLQQTLWQRGNDIRRDLIITPPGGTPASVSVHISPMRDREGQIHGLILNLRDTAEMQRFYEQMSRADRLATLGTFAAGLAHEVRNPLGAIKAAAQLLSESFKDTPGADRFIGVIVKEANRLNAIVGEVQEFSQPTAPTRTWVDPRRLLSETVKLSRHHAGSGSDSRVTIEERYEDDVPNIFANKDKIIQALLNVVVNAYQATPDGGKIVIEASYSAGGDELPVLMRIHNTGSRLDSMVARRIFEPFFTTKSQGSGLGLAIAHQIITHQGGRIEARNDETGVEFTIRFPVPFDQPSVGAENDPSFAEARDGDGAPHPRA